MYYTLRLFFENGGGACYIVSVGDYPSSVRLRDLRVGNKKIYPERGSVVN